MSNQTVLVIGQPINVAFFDAQHNTHQSVAHILSLGPIDPITNEPTISVAYPDENADARVLSSANWYKGYVRQTGVQHISHPDVTNGKLSIAWGGTVAQEDAPEIPKPDGDASNPIFARNDEVVDHAAASVSAATAVQTGAASQPTVQSPLINESTATVKP